MPNFKFKDINNRVIQEQEVSHGFIKLIDAFKKDTANYSKGNPIPLYFDHSKNIKVKRLLEDFKKARRKIETTNVSFPINNKKNIKSFIVYLSDVDPIKEVMAAHEVCHGLLYARGFKIIKHKKIKFDFLEGKVLSFAHHFPLFDLLKKYNLYHLHKKEGIYKKFEETIRRNIQILQQSKYNGSNHVRNIAATFQYLGMVHLRFPCATRMRLERLIKSLPSEIHSRYKAIRKIVNKIPNSQLITPPSCMRLMTEMLKLYGVENEFIKDFDGFDDYISYKGLLGQ